jgi:hypothetical protein
VMEKLREMALLEAYDRFIGLELSEVAVDCAASPRPLAEGRSRRAGVRWIGANRAPNADKAEDGRGIPVGAVMAPAKAATTRPS